MYTTSGNNALYVVFTGSVTSVGTTRTFGGGAYDNMQVRMVTDSRDITCAVTGTSTYTVNGENSVTTVYSMTETCPSTTFTHTGTIEMSLVNSHYILNGTAHYVRQGSSSGQIVHCTYTDFDLTAATCEDLADACGLPAASAACN